MNLERPSGTELQPSRQENPGSRTEPWLRGTLTELPAEQRAVLHALQLAQEDMERWCGPLREEELHARPHGLAPVSFHLRHIAGSLDRLLTYAEGDSLSEGQMRVLAAEQDANGSKQELLAELERGLRSAELRILAIVPARWHESRTVGRKQLPTTVAGLLIHCADHTQRHVGQAVLTAKLLVALRETGST